METFPDSASAPRMGTFACFRSQVPPNRGSGPQYVLAEACLHEALHFTLALSRLA
jgi:hypothetical protein